VKQICLQCERAAADHNLYCQETYCPAEMSPSVLDPGEWLGDIEIVRSLVVLRSAVLYEATHRTKRVFLKVAHPGTKHKERLKREAEFLRDIQLARQQHRSLPLLLPPYVNVQLSKQAEPYGKTMLRGHLLYFYIFEYFAGEPLRDTLLTRPQLWLNHCGLIVVGLAEAMTFLHSKGKFHFGLSPDAVIVHFAKKSNTPHVLLFDLGIMSDSDNMRQDWFTDFVLPAYLAPEFINVNSIRLDYRSDVYGLGLLLYELLVGQPAVPFKLRSDAEVYRIVQDNRRRTPMNRVEDVRALADIALKAVQQRPTDRQESAAEVAKQLKAFFGSVPEINESRWPSFNTIFLISGTLLAIAFVLTIALSIAGI
jgi:serine/threonine protein kinase